MAYYVSSDTCYDLYKAGQGDGNKEQGEQKMTVMKRLWKRAHRRLRKNKGFTLIEVLIVVAIIGVLAAVIIPNFTGLVGSGETEAGKAELITIQTAMDTMMAKDGLTSVTAVTTATSNMGSFPSSSAALYPDYLRNATAKGTYTCTISGLVSQASTGY